MFHIDGYLIIILSFPSASFLFRIYCVTPLSYRNDCHENSCNDVSPRLLMSEIYIFFLFVVASCHTRPTQRILLVSIYSYITFYQQKKTVMMLFCVLNTSRIKKMWRIIWHHLHTSCCDSEMRKKCKYMESCALKYYKYITNKTFFTLCF